MTDITGISQAAAAMTGLSASFFGYLIGAVVSLASAIVFAWAVGGRGDNTVPIIAGLTVGLFLSTAVGWFDVWVPIGVLIVVVFGWIFTSKSGMGI